MRRFTSKNVRALVATLGALAAVSAPSVSALANYKWK
jgi:hypothetical protein